MLTSLDAIEAHYRAYHSSVLDLSHKHPRLGSRNVRLHRRALCNLFRLVVVDPDRIDGAPLVDLGADEGDRLHVSDLAQVSSSILAPSGDGSGTPRSLPAPAAEDDLFGQPDAAAPAWMATDEAGGSSAVQIAGGSVEYREAASLHSVAAALVDVPRETEGERQERTRREERERAEAAARAEDERRKAADAEAAAKAAAEAEAAAAASGKKGATKAPAKPAATPASSAPAPAAAGKKPATGPAAAAAAKKEAEAAAEAEAIRRRDAEAAERARMEAEEEASRIRELADRSTAVFVRGVEDARGIPLDPAGAPGIHWADIPLESACSWVEAIREKLLEELEAHAVSRRKDLATRAADRAALYTAELEERLRRHWPRRGEAETSVRSPREDELLAHAERLQRHSAAWRERAQAQADAFDREAGEARSHTDSFAKRLEALQASLPAQASLAALQGVQSRAKGAAASFEVEAAAWRDRLALHADAEPRKLRTLNREFLRACPLFAEGGSYDAAEQAAVRDDLAALEASVLDKDVDRRRSDTETVAEGQREALARMATFDRAFEEALRSLSMRQGLGKRFGAPRRRCTERLRTIVAWSNAEAKAIDARLDELQSLLRDDTPGTTPSTTISSAVDADEDAAAVRLMIAGATLAQAEARAASEVRRMRKRQRRAAGGGDDDSTDDEDDDSKDGGTKATSRAAKSESGDGFPPPCPDGEVTLRVWPPPAWVIAGTDPTAPIPEGGDDEGGAASGGTPSARGKLDTDGSAALGPPEAALAQRVRWCILWLRRALARRARFLEALKSPCRPLDDCRTLSLSDEAKPGDLASPTTDASTEAVASAPAPPVAAPAPKAGSRPATSTPAAAVPAAPPADVSAPEDVGLVPPAERWSAQVAVALEACRTETRSLFAEEGSPLPAGEEGLPQSLRAYLIREDERAGSARGSAAVRLRSQVARLRTLLDDAPRAVLSDVARRCDVHARQSVAWWRRSFRREAEVLVSAREVNAAALTPRLSDPNRAAELHALRQAELQRCQAHRQLLALSRGREVAAALRSGDQLARRLVHAARWLLRVMDACLMPEDLASDVIAPTSDEPAASLEADPADQRLGIRRVRKQMRRDAAEAAAAAELAKAPAVAVPPTSAKPGSAAPASATAKKGSTAPAAPAAPPVETTTSTSDAQLVDSDLAGCLLPAAAVPGADVDGAGVPTRVYKRRLWDALAPLPVEALRPPEPPAWAADAELHAWRESAAGRSLPRTAEPAATPAASASASRAASPRATASPRGPASKPATGASADPAKKGGAASKSTAAASAPASEVVTTTAPPLPPMPGSGLSRTELGRCVSLYNTASRHAVRVRDHLWAEGAATARSRSERSAAWFAKLYASVDRWEAFWLTSIDEMSRAARAAAGDGDT